MRRRLLLAALAAASTPAAAMERLNAAAGLALKGYDAVAYHTEGKPRPGLAEFRASWGGATWRFASAANRDAFLAAPARYAPAYGGFCAYAVSRGYTAPIDPEAWRVEGGRLYLNYDRATRALWEKDIRGEVARADANWPRLSAR